VARPDVRTCVLCRTQDADEWREAADGSGKLICGRCWRDITDNLLAVIAAPRCEGCGRTAFQGCDCDANRRAIGRGERRKGELES